MQPNSPSSSPRHPSDGTAPLMIHRWILVKKKSARTGLRDALKFESFIFPTDSSGPICMRLFSIGDGGAGGRAACLQRCGIL